MACHSVNDVEHGIAFPREREIVIHNITKAHAGMFRLEPTPEPCIDAKNSGNAVVARHHHMLHPAFGSMLAEKLIEVRVCRRDDNIALHHLARRSDQE